MLMGAFPEVNPTAIKYLHCTLLAASSLLVGEARILLTYFTCIAVL